MTSVTGFWPLLCGTHRYEKTLSTRGRGDGVIIEAPILAYLVETKNGRILYDVVATTPRSTSRHCGRSGMKTRPSRSGRRR